MICAKKFHGFEEVLNHSELSGVSFALCFPEMPTQRNIPSWGNEERGEMED